MAEHLPSGQSDSRPHKEACLSCGGDMTDGQLRRQAQQNDFARRASDDDEATYAHLCAVIENCKHSSVEAIRHQLVGLLPETREMDPELAARLRAHDMGHLVERHEAAVRAAWAEHGYGGSA